MNRNWNILILRCLVCLIWAICSHIFVGESTANPIEDIVDIKEINPRIMVEMKYATDNNIAQTSLYSMNKCLLRKSTALKLDAAQILLEKQNLGLKVWDCYRPLAAQKKLWTIMPDSRYVADPTKGSRHNRASSVDVTLVDAFGKELLMPTEFDDFSNRSYRKNADLRQQAGKNSCLLEEYMKKVGFIPLSTEWWHFDDADWKKFKRLDIPFEKL